MNSTARWNVNRFLKEVEALPDKNNYIFSEYENINGGNSKFKVECRICGNIWKVVPTSFFGKQQSRCFACKTGERWNVDRFLRELEVLSDKDNYIFFDYDNINTNTSKFAVQCKKCGHIWTPTVRSFFGKNKSRCFVCTNGEQWSRKKFLRELEGLSDKDNYIFSDYDSIKDSLSKFTIRCKKCDYVWQSNCSNFFNHGTRCFNCNRGERWSLERFLKELDVLSDRDDYIFSDYDNINSCYYRFTVKCKKCNYIWKATPISFFNGGHRCVNCSVGERWTIDRVTRVFLLLQDSSDFTLLLDDTVEIKSGNSKVKIKCHKCNHIWNVSIDNFFNQSRRCPKCKTSKGEKQIEYFLQKNNINFEPQKRFDTCRNKKPLPFDFYLPEFNLLIEMQGEQHFFIGRRSRDEEKNLRHFEGVKIRDAIKKQWATDNGYTFLEIRYDQIDQIEEILTQELNI